MKTVTSIFQGVGVLSIIVGVLSVINTIFDLHLRFKGADLPNDMVAAFAIIGFGLVFGVIGFLMGKKYK